MSSWYAQLASESKNKAGQTCEAVPDGSIRGPRFMDMLRSEGVGELLIRQEYVVRQSIQEIEEIVLVLH